MEAKHFDENKIPLQYILAMPGLDAVARVGMYGFHKYGDQWNYRAGMPWMKLLGSCSRHLAAFIRGENLDLCQPECSLTASGECAEMKHSHLPHLAHLCYDALMLLEYPGAHDDKDDRYIKADSPKCLLYGCTSTVCRDVNRSL